MGSGTTPASAEDMAVVARTLQQQPDPAETLSAVCEMAATTLGGDDAAITSVRNGHFVTISSTSGRPERVDALQYATGQGPCLDALREREVFRTGDLAAEERWPRFGARAALEEGVLSMISNVLYVKECDLGALNVYSTRRDAFSQEDEGLLRIFGTHAAVALQAAKDHDLAGNLQVALHHSRRIGAAVGILMYSRRVTETEAFAALRTASQNLNRKVADIADEVVATGALPPWPPEEPAQ